MSDHKASTLEDFRAGRECRFDLSIEPVEKADGLASWVATMTTEDGEKLASCEADSPSAAAAGVMGAANDSLARIHMAGRIGNTELQEKLGLESFEEHMKRTLNFTA